MRAEGLSLSDIGDRIDRRDAVRFLAANRRLTANNYAHAIASACAVIAAFLPGDLFVPKLTQMLTVVGILALGVGFNALRYPSVHDMVRRDSDKTPGKAAAPASDSIAQGTINTEDGKTIADIYEESTLVSGDAEADRYGYAAVTGLPNSPVTPNPTMQREPFAPPFPDGAFPERAFPSEDISSYGPYVTSDRSTIPTPDPAGEGAIPILINDPEILLNAELFAQHEANINGGSISSPPGSGIAVPVSPEQEYGTQYTPGTNVVAENSVDEPGALLQTDGSNLPMHKDENKDDPNREYEELFASLENKLMPIQVAESQSSDPIKLRTEVRETLPIDDLSTEGLFTLDEDTNTVPASYETPVPQVRLLPLINGNDIAIDPEIIVQPSGEVPIYPSTGM